MSAFLGPVHHWLFKKISLFENLEKETILKLSETYGDDVSNIHGEAEAKYGNLIPAAPLESLIDTGNIHGWLQNKIQIAETRQAATYKALLDKYGEDIVPVIEDCYQLQGAKYGLEVNSELGLLTAVDLYKQLNNYLLDGMPCDHVNNVIDSNPEKLVWVTTQCLHKPYWKSVGMNEDIMYTLRFRWVRSFIEAANPAFTYEAEGSLGKETIKHTIQANSQLK